MSAPTQSPPAAPPTSGPPIEVKARSNRPKFIAAGVALLVLIAAVFGIRALNKPQAFGPELTVATWSSDLGSNALIKYVADEIAPDYDITIKTRPIDDIVQINKAVDTGEIAGNWFQHRPFLNDAIKANGFQLEHAVQAFVWKQASYSKKYDAWDEVPRGAKIGLRSDPAGQAIALLDLAWSKQITLKPGKTTLQSLPQLDDIATNPKDYEFVTVPIGSLARTLDDTDVIVVHIADVIASGISDDLKIDEPPAPAGSEGGLVISTKTKDDPYIEKLVKAFSDPRVDQYLRTSSDKTLTTVLGPVPDKAAAKTAFRGEGS